MRHSGVLALLVQFVQISFIPVFYQGLTSCIPGSSQAGAVDEESFMSAFEEVKRVNIYSGRALAEELGKIRDAIQWTFRI